MSQWRALCSADEGGQVKDVFLCHTGSDKPWVENLGARLEEERIDGRPISVFLDKWDIDFGENILQRIEEGLEESRFVAVVLSPAMVRAEWPRLEWQSQVYDDPAGRKARILPIVLHRYDPETEEKLRIPLPLKILKYFDFSDEKHFEDEFQRFLARVRGQPPSRGGLATSAAGFLGRESPDPVTEPLVSNLLPVLQYPELWSDLTAVQSAREVWKTLKGMKVPPVLVHGQRLYSTYSPEDTDNPFRQFLTGSEPARHDPTEWLRDQDQSRLLVRLLNSALNEHCYHLGIRRVKRERHQYFVPTFGGKPRSFQWSPGGRMRTLAKLTPQKDGTYLGVHHSAKMRFATIGEAAYLVLEPGWIFTKDGATPLPGPQLSVLSTKWGGRERNAGVLRSLLMWAMLLSEGEDSFDLWMGHGSARLSATPENATISVGLMYDSIRLDTLLSGPPGGEVPDNDDEDLDRLALLKATGVLEEQATGDAPGPPRESGPDSVVKPSE